MPSILNTKKVKKMKNLLVALFLMCSFASFSQGFDKGDKLLNVGLNLGGTYGGGLGIGGSYEVGVTDFISVGGQADYNTWNYGWGGYSWKYNFFNVGGRGSYHFGNHFLKADNLDLYAGLALGYRISQYKDPSGWSGSYSSSYGSGVFLGGYAGARYYFKPSLGAFAEVGSNTSVLKAGVTFKF
jgi:hypothetical protein